MAKKNSKQDPATEKATATDAPKPRAGKKSDSVAVIYNGPLATHTVRGYLIERGKPAKVPPNIAELLSRKKHYEIATGERELAETESTGVQVG